MSGELPWVAEARASIGVAEMPGAATSPILARWLIGARAWWSDDETPWCGLAMWAWMRACDIPTPRMWMRAKAWLDWGVPIAAAGYGAVVVFDRPGGGHVGLVVGKDTSGRLLVLGGNQGNRVNIAPFETSRVVGFRWPSYALALRGQHNLPMVAMAGPPSRDEA